jgi:PAS domain S-box-containing protein
MSGDENEGRSNENGPSTSLLDKMIRHTGLVGVGFGVLFWILESFIHAFVFGEGTFSGQLLSPSLNEIWMRSFVWLLLAGFGFYIQFTVCEIRKPRNVKVVAKPVNLRRHILWTAFFWTVVVCVSLFWGIYQQYYQADEAAKIESGAVFNKDLSYRRWVSGHGGVYAPVTEKSPANPYLSHVEERDITSPSGRELTLINPAYMTRQIHELAEDQYGVRGHITSLNPIRPENAPDDWEKQALEAFDVGEQEVSGVTSIEGRKYLRVMWPMKTEENCLKCHAEQGYKAGDIRGGISVSVPMEPYLAIAWSNSFSLILGHSLLWLIGTLGIVYGGKQLERQLSISRQAEAEVRESERRMLEMLRNVQLVTVMLDKNGTITYANDYLCKLSGYTKEEIVGGNWFEIFIPAEHRAEIMNVHQKVIAGELELVGHYENEILTKDAQKRLIYWSNTLFSYSYEGDIIGTTSIGEDITQRKESEQKLQEHHDRLITVLNSLDSLVYVADIDTYEILFINEYGHKIWGDVAGKTCWKTLQSDQNGPCEFCTNKMLFDENGQPSGVYRWEFQNTTDRQWYECHDRAIKWTDGRFVSKSSLLRNFRARILIRFLEYRMMAAFCTAMMPVRCF